MPTLPVVPVKRPAILTGQSNGKLDPDILVTWTPPWSSTAVTFVPTAMRCYKALVTTAYRAGFAFISVGSYRSYERQVALFKERYRRVQHETDVWWDGSFWRHVSGAVAAIPGTSNHGLALADDLGEQRDADPSAESISDAAVDWLVANELKFGFSHERQDEPWHVRNTTGDTVPDAVLAFEQGDDVSAEEVWEFPSRQPAIAGVSAATQLGEVFWRVGRPGGLLETMAKTLERVAAEVGIDTTELQAIREAAEAGTADALGALSAQEIADLISDQLAPDVADLLAARLRS